MLTLIIYGSVIAGGFTLLLWLPRFAENAGARTAMGSPGGGGSRRPPALIMHRTHDRGVDR